MDMTTHQGPKSPRRPWHKSRRSNSQGACVEVAEGTTTLMRDTQHRHEGHLEFGASEWGAMLRAAV